MHANLNQLIAKADNAQVRRKYFSFVITSCQGRTQQPRIELRPIRGALEMLSQVTSLEFGPHSIQMNCVVIVMGVLDIKARESYGYDEQDFIAWSCRGR